MPRTLAAAIIIAASLVACGDDADGDSGAMPTTAGMPTSAGMPGAGMAAAGASAAGMPAPAGMSAAGMSGGATPSFAAIYTDILEPSCAVAGPCHMEENPTGLGLPDAATAYTALVGMPASDIALCGDFAGQRVTPGDPDTSLLFNKISSQMPACGGAMPPGGAMLPADQIERIRAWIAGNAPNN